MDEQQIRKNFANNLVRLRKMKNLNQNDLASVFNYSNKSISKWETGETIPDISVLKMIADYFQISIDELISNNEITDKQKAHKRHRLITLASFGLAYLVAAVVFLFLSLFNVPKSWLAFIFAIPTSAIVLIVFTKLWFNKLYLFLSIELLIWSIFAILIYFINSVLLPALIIAIILSILFGVFIKIKKYVY